MGRLSEACARRSSGSSPGYSEPLLPFEAGHTTAPHNQTDTSRLAAKSIEDQMSRLDRLTWRIVSSRGRMGATNEEISDLSSEWNRFMPIQTVCARTNRLSGGGHNNPFARDPIIRDSGLRRAGRRSGRPAKVWVAAKRYDACTIVKPEHLRPPLP